MVKLTLKCFVDEVVKYLTTIGKANNSTSSKLLQIFPTTTKKNHINLGPSNPKEAGKVGLKIWYFRIFDKNTGLKSIKLVRDQWDAISNPTKTKYFSNRIAQFRTTYIKKQLYIQIEQNIKRA